VPNVRPDPPRLHGWVSLARFAQTSDVFLSPHRHRRFGSNPIVSRRAASAAQTTNNRRLTDRARGSRIPSGLGRGTAMTPRRLPSCSEFLEDPRTDMLRSGRGAERRDRAPVHLACSATLPSRSASVSTQLD